MPHAFEERCQGGAAVEAYFSAQEILSVDAVRALVNHVEAVVAPVLLHRIVARVAIAAMHLDRETVRLEAPLAGPALGDRRKDFEQQGRVA
jgi:hypothetical protein